MSTNDANELYPIPPERIRVRMLTGPHELMLYKDNEGAGFGISCVCTHHRVDFDPMVSDDQMWRQWLEDVHHSTDRPAPAGPTPHTHEILLAELRAEKHEELLYEDQS